MEIMSDHERQILELAESYKETPEAFVPILQVLLQKASLNDKMRFFFKAGMVLGEHSYHHLSLVCWESLLRYALDLDNTDLVITCFLNMGDAYGRLGDYEKAVSYTNEAIRRTRQINDRVGEYQSYGSLGLISEHCGKLKEATQYYQKALKITQEINDIEGQLITYERLSEVCIRSGAFSMGIDNLNKLLEKNDLYDRGNLKRKLACYISLGYAYIALENYRKAIEYSEQGLQIATHINDAVSLAKVYINLGISYKRLKRYQASIEAYRKSLEISKQLRDQAGELSCYLNLAGMYQDMYQDVNELETATGYYNQALNTIEQIKQAKKLEVWEQTKCKRAESTYYTGMGIIYSKYGDFKKAIQCFEASCEIKQELEDRNGIANSYLNLGNAYKDSGNLKKAKDFYDKSIEICQKTGNRLTEYACNVGLGLIYYKQDPQRALDYFKTAIHIAEKVSIGLLEDINLVGLYARLEDTYRYIISLYLKFNDSEQAFEYLEQSKSRAFLSLLATTKIKPTVKITSQLQSLLDREEQYLISLQKAKTRYLQPGYSPEVSDLDEIIGELEAIYDKIENKYHDAEYVFLRKGKARSLKQIQSVISSQCRNIVLVEYFVTHNNIIIFIVTSRSSDIYVESIPLPSSTMKYVFDSTLKATIFGGMSINDVLSQLDYLVEPISKYLKSGDLIYFVPHNFLHYLPLHALKLNAVPIIKQHPVVYVSNASLIAFLQNKGSDDLRSLVSFGVNSIGNAKEKEIFESEAREVAGIFQGECYLDSEVTKKKVIDAITDKDIIHFSCHGMFKENAPLESGIQLYEGESLIAREIFNLNLNSRLAVLSACQSGVSENRGGDELIGLTRSLFYAGIPSIVVTLWSVDAISARELMVEFYKFLKKGLDKATALQQAQIKIMERYNDPRHWSPFVLTGDWK
jgi:CHAT domain-containing protein/Tfp pilus assembly protein PilF